MGQSLFATSKAILESAECELLGASAIPRPFSWIRREIIHPFFYVMEGGVILLDTVKKIALYFTIFYVVGIWLSWITDNLSKAPSTALFLSFLGASIIGLFALPSTYTDHKFPEKFISRLTKIVAGLIDSTTELEGLRANLEIMENRAAQRVKALRFTLAGIWAIFLFGFSQSLGLMTKIVPNEHFTSILGNTLGVFLVAAILGLLPLLAINCYQLANELVFKGLQFACNEIAIELIACELEGAAQPIPQDGC